MLGGRTTTAYWDLGLLGILFTPPNPDFRWVLLNLPDEN
jgi:hypothetical protein